MKRKEDSEESSEERERERTALLEGRFSRVLATECPERQTSNVRTRRGRWSDRQGYSDTIKERTRVGECYWMLTLYKIRWKSKSEPLKLGHKVRVPQ